MMAEVGSVMKCRGCRLTVALCKAKLPFASAPLCMSGMPANCFDQFGFLFFFFAAPCPNKQRGYRMWKQVTWLFSLLSCVFMSENTAHDDICALSGCVCVLTVLCLFVIKLVQTCRARPPRAVTHTPFL